MGFVIDHAGYSSAFLLLAALPILGWLWIRTLQELPNEQHDNTKSGMTWNLWRQPRFRQLLLLNCLAPASFDVHAFVVPILGHERGLSASVIGMILGSYAIATAAIRGMIPVIAAKLQEWIFITAAMMVTALSFFVYPFAQSPIAMAICSAAIGMSMGGVTPMLMSLLHQITARHHHGEVVALRHLVTNTASVAMPMLLGAAGGLIGINSLFWLMSVVVGLGSRFSSALRSIDNSSDL